MALTVQLIENESEFFALEQEWNDLLERSSNATIYTTFEWARVAWNFRDSSISPFILKFYDGSTLVGIVPFRLRKRRFRPKVLQFITTVLPYWSLADSLDVLTATGYEDVVVRSMLNFLQKNTKLWDSIDWPEVGGTSPTYRVLSQTGRGSSLRMFPVQNSTHSEIKLPESLEDYISSSKTLSDTERRLRKIIRECDARIEQVCDIEEIYKVFDVMLLYHDQRWSEAEKEQRHTIIEFGKQLAPLLMRRGWLDITTLRANNIPVAIIWNFPFRDTIYCFRHAFNRDEQWRKYSVGTVIFAHSIKQAIENGYRTFDLTRGDYDYKTRFGGTTNENYWFRITHHPLIYMYYSLRPHLDQYKQSFLQKLSRVRSIRNETKI